MEPGVYLRRISRLAEFAEERGLCRVAVVDESSVFYLTGYRGAGALVVSPDGSATLYVPVLEYLNALDQLRESGLYGDVDVKAYTPYGLPRELVVSESVEVVEKPLEKIIGEGCEACGLAGGGRRLWEGLSGACNRVEDVSEYVYQMRMRKEPWEIERMRVAAEIAEAALQAAMEELREGVSEAEVAGRIYYEMRRRGADDYSFPPIVAFGLNTIYPHAIPSHRRRLRGPTPVLIDLGAKYMGYSSDMTRTFYFAGSPPEFRHIAEGVLDALYEAIDAVHSGVRASEVDAKARGVLAKYGLDKYFIHSLGHGIGIDVHEPPRVTFNSDTTLEDGMVVTIEPGVYIPGRMGVRIEEMVLVTKRKAITLTKFPAKLW